jgi:hypothetical protein
MTAPCADPRDIVERAEAERTAWLGFSPTRGPSVALVATVAAGALGAAALLGPETVDDGPVLCPFRLVTGLPCPGCGLTRSWVYLLHGQVGDAMAANPFGIVALLLAVGLVAAVASSVVRRRPVPTYAGLLGSLGRGRSGTWARYAGVLVLAGWLGFGVVRMLLAAA